MKDHPLRGGKVEGFVLTKLLISMPVTSTINGEVECKPYTGYQLANTLILDIVTSNKQTDETIKLFTIEIFKTTPSQHYLV
jgi:hypothetical protein